MMKFDKKKINSKLLGEKLREIRESKTISLNEISKFTKISQQYLEKLENSDYDSLPADVYVIGFLRSYSHYLGLNADDIIRLYKKERLVVDNIKNKGNFLPRKKNRFQKITLIIDWKLTVFLFVGLILFLIIGYFYREGNKFISTPRLLISQPINNKIIQENSIEIVGLTDVGNEISINGQKIFADENGHFRQRIGLKWGINKLVVEATNKFGKKITKEINLSAQYKKEIVNNEKDSKLMDIQDKTKYKDKIILVIKAKDESVWLAVKTDGLTKYNGTILPGSEQSFEAKSEISITSGKANQTLVKINGEKIFHQLADQAGVIRDIVFKKDNINKKNIEEK